MTGYSEARVERTVAICAQGAAHGAWNDATRRVEAGRDVRSCCHSSTDEISDSVDIAWLNVLVARGSSIISEVESYESCDYGV